MSERTNAAAATAAAPPASGSPPASTPTAGRLLREARERQGLHIAALAASIKVVPKKLELLEADRIDQLPDITFTRALAQTVCRALKIDAAPVMALLPNTSAHRLEMVGEGLNAPFRERPGVLVQRDGPAFASSPAFWVVALILLAAGAVFFLPARLLGIAGPAAPASAVAQSAPASSAELPGMPPGGLDPVPGVVTEVVPAAGSSPATPSAEGTTGGFTAGASGTAAGELPAGAVQVRTTGVSWVEVTDAGGAPLIARLMQPGEAVGLDGAAPFRLRIGNAAATQVVFRGQATELAAFTRDNVARLELK